MKAWLILNRPVLTRDTAFDLQPPNTPKSQGMNELRPLGTWNAKFDTTTEQHCN